MIKDVEPQDSADRHFSSKARVWRENPSRTLGRWIPYGQLSEATALAESRFPDSMGMPLYIEHLPARLEANNVGGRYDENQIDQLQPAETISIEEWKKQGLAKIIILNANIKTTIPGKSMAGIETSKSGEITFWYKRKNGQILPSTYQQKRIQVTYVPTKTTPYKN